MNKLEELQQQIDQIQWRLNELRGEKNHFVDNNKKVAVHAKEKWQKEKVAKVWGVKMDIKNEVLLNPPYNYAVISRGDDIFLHTYDDVAIKYHNYNTISFQDFCKQHGVSDRPDFVRDITGKIYKVEYWDIYNGKPQIYPEAELSFWKPATEKEYLEQESEKEPGLKLNEDFWKPPEDEFAKAYSEGYYEGASDMQQAIYERALEIYDNNTKNYPWHYCKYLVFDEAMNGELTKQ